MIREFEELRLPPIYKRNSRECFLDPIREKLIYITPEESVRQRIISYLLDELEIPIEMISVEEHLSHYGLKSNKRADIIIHQPVQGNHKKPIAVIECKAPEVPLSEKGIRQMLEYCDAIEADYAMLTNGYAEICYKYQSDKEKYSRIERLPAYEEMLDGEYVELNLGELPPRIPFTHLKDYLKNRFTEFEEDYWAEDISPQTELSKAVPAFNLLEGLLDTRKQMPTGDYGMFRLIEDYGVRMLSYGNSSGGSFFGPYRSFLVDVNGNTEFVSMNITTYWKGQNTDNVKTCLVVAIDNEKETHHALQLVIDDNLVVIGNQCDFYHHGRITVGNLGSAKIEGLRECVRKKCPKLISGNRFFLGSLINDRLWGLDDPEVISLVANIISYALIRDEYRAIIKENKANK